MCCKLPLIAELNKPADMWCKFCKPGHGGCTIYAERPQVCVDFQCEWLKHKEFDAHWKPDVAKMVLFVSKASDTMTFMNIMVDLAWPNRWHEPEYYARIKQIAVAGLDNNVLTRVQVGKRSWIILPHVDREIPNGVTQFDMTKNRFGMKDVKFKMEGG